MSDYLQQRIQDFAPRADSEFVYALKQIMQEVALLGLERGGFFEKAAFYGGTALRLLHGLPRFSEDLDFTLFRPEPKFDLSHYFNSLERELEAHGFETKILAVKKTEDSSVDSAFIKAETRIHLLKIKTPHEIASRFQKRQLMQIKFEVDVDPATHFESEPRALLNPSSFEIISLKLSDLFAGKMHATLYRNWKSRVKGRDFYDLLWDLKHSIPIRLDYLKEKMVQGGSWKRADMLGREQVIELFKRRIERVDFEQAKADVAPFIQDLGELKPWKKEFFNQVIDQLKVE